MTIILTRSEIESLLDVADAVRAVEAAFEAHATGRTRMPSKVYLDVPEPHAAAVALAQANGMSSVFETARMYRGLAPECKLNTVYGITTFELG